MDGYFEMKEDYKALNELLLKRYILYLIGMGL